MTEQALDRGGVLTGETDLQYGHVFREDGRAVRLLQHWDLTWSVPVRGAKCCPKKLLFIQMSVYT